MPQLKSHYKGNTSTMLVNAHGRVVYMFSGINTQALSVFGDYQAPFRNGEITKEHAILGIRNEIYENGTH